MSDELEKFIQVHRTFHDLALSEEEGKESGLSDPCSARLLSYRFWLSAKAKEA
jgi:hypothetical protein